MRHCRKPESMADAAHAILSKPARAFTGNFLIDDTVLYDEGVREFTHYSVDPALPLMGDMFVPGDLPAPPGVQISSAIDTARS